MVGGKVGARGWGGEAMGGMQRMRSTRVTNEELGNSGMCNHERKAMCHRRDVLYMYLRSCERATTCNALEMETKAASGSVESRSVLIIKTQDQ